MNGGSERIVVGVDGSEGSKAALRWALGYAADTGGEVTALITWAHPTYYGLGAPMVEEDLDQAASTTLAESVGEATAQPDKAVPVQQNVVRGLAAQALLDAAASADLLVVGSRGHGGFTGALLGSVSQHCVHHSPCPIVVVRDSSAKH